jgi:hypothetical protein
VEEAAPRFVVPYGSSPRPDAGHAFRYWSLSDSLALESPFPFRHGDAVDLISVLGDTIRVVPRAGPAGERLPHLHFISNDVPLGGAARHEFSAHGCRILLLRESEADGNKVYTMAVLLDRASACVRGRAPGSRLAWQMDADAATAARLPG